VDKCIEKYISLSENVFRLDNVKMGIPVGQEHCRFNEEELEKALKEVINKFTGDENTPMADPKDKTPECCPVFVIATEGEDASGPVKLFRTYGHYKDQCPIWQAARATSAAPTYFPPAWVKVPAPGGWYIDGGLKRNNPSEVALAEARKYWKTARRFCIVSIGTAVQKTADFIENPLPPEKRGGEKPSKIDESQRVDSEASTIFSLGRVKEAVGSMFLSLGVSVKSAVSYIPFAHDAVQLSGIPGGIMTLSRFAKELVKLSTESEDTHRKISELANSHDSSLQFPYYRFNVPSGMEEIGLEEWRKITKMGALTRGYLNSIEKEIERCAENVLNPSPFEST
jgi:predicted acylesterase/phospholipase RssA